MPSFSQTINPTPFGFFDSDVQFQNEADGAVTFVKRKLGDDILSVEITRKQIWACLEESVCEYSRLVHEMKIQSELINVLGLPTGSTNLTNIYPRQSLEYLVRQAEPYASEAFLGGPYDAQLGYINMIAGQQDYNIYTSINDAVSGNNLWLSIPSGSRGRMKIVEVFHFEPTAAQSSLLNASNITNFLATNFNYESYVNSTIFYTLPVFEDVLRRGMLETAFRVRRSNYSYDVIGSNLRVYPIPSVAATLGKMFIKVFAQPSNPVNPAGIGGGMGTDDSLYGISGPSNVPLNNLPYKTITDPGRQWIRQYCLALSRELLGLIRSKMKTIPIPNADLQLNGEELVQTGREDKNTLRDQLKEWLSNLTNAKLMEQQATLAENMQKMLKYVPMPLGKSISIG
jgi:hypothetical protein